MGRAALCLHVKEGRVLWVQRGGAAHFVILSGEKRRMLAYLKQEN